MPGDVVVVDPDGRLKPVAEAIRDGGVERVRTVEGVPETEDGVACILIPDAPADDEAAPIDGLELLERVRRRLGDVPTGIYVFGDRERVKRVLDAGADTALRVPPKRTQLLAARMRALATGCDPESEAERYRSFLKSYPEIVYLKDTDGLFLDITSYLGTEIEEVHIEQSQVAGLTDYELFERELADDLYEQEQQLMADEASMTDHIEQFRQADETHWISTSKVPRYSDDGEVVGLVGDSRDITKIKRQEEMMATLHEASRRLVRAGDRLSVGRVAVSIATEMNALPQARVELRDPESGRREPVAAVEDDDHRWDPRLFDRAAASGRSYLVGRNGSLAAVADEEGAGVDHPPGIDEVTGLCIPLGDHGVLGLDAGEQTLDPFIVELSHVLAANVEAALDRAKQQRQLGEQAERLEEFALLGSHELRNRLQVALGTAERARALNDLDAVDDVIDTLGRMNRLVTQLLTLARTGTVSQATQQLALSGVAETAWSAVDSPDSELVVEPDGILTADREGLLEVFEILFRTAVESGGSDTVRVGTTEDGFFIADDGTAITPDQHEGLLEPTYSDVNGGTGDSIYLVSVIADAHDWSVEVEKRDEGGTRFTFTGVGVKQVE